MRYIGALGCDWRIPTNQPQHDGARAGATSSHI